MTYVAEDEEEDVDEGVRGADAALHPHWRGREVSIAMRVFVVVVAACVVVFRSAGCCCRGGGVQCIPGSGGKRMANKPRKQSEEHMVEVVKCAALGARGIHRERRLFRS